MSFLSTPEQKRFAGVPFSFEAGCFVLFVALSLPIGPFAAAAWKLSAAAMQNSSCFMVAGYL
jgi:hypothetical protein